MRSLLLLLLAAATLAAGPAAERAPGRQGRARFVPVEIFLDSGTEALVAYQIEITYDPKRVKILSLEGGEPQAFNNAPHYDARGMTAGRIIIAAYTTADAQAPHGTSRLARLHLRVEGEAAPLLVPTLIAAARPGGERIDAKVQIR